LLPYLTPALEHLRIGETANPQMTLNVWDSESTGVQMLTPPCEWADFTDRGDIWGFNSKRIKTAFHWSEFSVNVMDMNSNTGVYWVKTPKTFPYWVYSSPFRTIIQWWMEKNGCQLLHAAAVGTEYGAVLITGKGGVGKSTTALACLNAGLFYLADDYLIVKKDPEPIVYSLYSTAKINMEDRVKFPALQQFVGKPVNENQEKAVLFLFPGLNLLVIKEMPLRAIFTPEIKKQHHTTITPVSFWPIQRAMSFTTMSQLPGVGTHTHDYISDFTKRLPCFTIGLGKDLGMIPNAIIDFLKNPEIESVRDNEPNTSLEKPLISVIIPVYNGEKFIREAVENVLSQNYPALEIIIVDDGSTDNTKQIIAGLTVDVRYFHQPNEGPASARNRGIKDVSGEFIVFLDADDQWPENNLNLLLNEIQKDRALDVVRGYAQLFRNNQNGSLEFTGNPRDSFPDYIGAGIYRRAAFEKVGLYDPTMRFGEDKDWFNRARELKVKLKRVDEVTLLVRRHGGNMTEGKSLVELNTLKVYKKMLERKRAQNSAPSESQQ
nr:glycosyltransferase [Bacteroidota bacterium]